jgi:hypothetical protein
VTDTPESENLFDRLSEAFDQFAELIDSAFSGDPMTGAEPTDTPDADDPFDFGEGFFTRPNEPGTLPENDGERHHYTIEYQIDLKDGSTISNEIDRYNYYDPDLMRRMVQASEFEIDLEDISELHIWVDDYETYWDEYDYEDMLDPDNTETPGGKEQ